ncbi:methyltransferase domain-containing protein [Paenibacillus hexagrammi]|uniref:Methyltransferase domain-containing protein n=1 Tax=Paenibacillus hexagrammi TaxID=2908839 RepID=A0ABY3SQ31_9BACL|nr:methyltransferase domain-containing protein [Paenibacillus sp. YPD9-1]UJF35794.1 methyltransferase domain-containing protein [Paenibacillus sp. YPD9-1]
MRIDIGCGSVKHPGCCGIDIQSHPEVDVVCDIDKGLPFADQSVEFVMASRILPYVNDFVKVMSEIYRVCADRAVVCILAPYAHSFHHVTNPYFKQKFDEHSPRFLTEHFFQPLMAL